MKTNTMKEKNAEVEIGVGDLRVCSLNYFLLLGNAGGDARTHLFQTD